MKYSDTTVKLEAAVVREIAPLVPAGETLTGYVRQVLQRDIRRAKMRRAAEQYQDFLGRNPGESASLNAWADADLAAPPKRRPAKSSKT